MNERNRVIDSHTRVGQSNTTVEMRGQFIPAIPRSSYVEHSISKYSSCQSLTQNAQHSRRPSPASPAQPAQPPHSLHHHPTSPHHHLTTHNIIPPPMPQPPPSPTPPSPLITRNHTTLKTSTHAVSSVPLSHHSTVQFRIVSDPM